MRAGPLSHAFFPWEAALSYIYWKQGISHLAGKGIHMLRCKTWMGVFLAVTACVSGARAAAPAADTGFVLRVPQFDINFSRAWSVVFPPTFLGKNGGFEGLAYVGVDSG